MLARIEQCPRKLTGFLTAVAASVVVCALWAGLASAAAGVGQIEICKSAANGAAGTSFTFRLQRGTKAPLPDVTVLGGTCSSPIDVAANNTTGVTWKITELNGADWALKSATTVPEGNLMSVNTRTGLVKVRVYTGSETQVTVENAQSAATIKVCKWSASPELQGQQYSFTVGGTTVQATAGNSLATAGCSATVPTQIGSRVKVVEAVPANETVAHIDYSPASIGSTTSGASATIRTVAGANVVTFEDEPVGPPQTGYIEICKDAFDYYVHGTYHFEITNTAGTQNLDRHSDAPGDTGEDVLVGQCTAPIEVPAGPVLVTEKQNKSTELSEVWTDPANALGLVNLANQTAVVVVPVSDDPTGEVQVHFVNKTLVATVKVCKFLPAGSEALAGERFRFEVTSDATGHYSWWVTIVASAGVNGACKIVTDDSGAPVQFPIGAEVTAVEDLEYFPFVSGDGNDPGDDDEQSTTIVGGINTVNFKNVALGQLEICKNMIVNSNGATESGLSQQFTFNYVNTANSRVKGTVKVRAGACSLPQVVPAGNYTVTEDLSKLQVELGNDPWSPKVNAFQFVASDARGPLGDNRCVPQQSTGENYDITTGPVRGTVINTNCGNPLTVTVPYFNGNSPDFGETQVTVWNKLVRASIKICKRITSDSTAQLGNSTFSFSGGTSTDGSLTNVQVKAGTCTGNLGNFPIAGDGLVPAVVTITEAPFPGAHVSDITLTGGYNADTNGPAISFNPGPGVNVVTYYNTSDPINPPQP